MERFSMLGLFTTNRCNLNCIYCSTGAGKKLGKELTLSEKKRCIREAKKKGMTRVNLHGSGEPMLDKDFKDIIEYIHSLKMRPFVVTNGTLIDRDYASWLKKRRVYVLFKLNSFSEDTTDFLCGKKNSYKWLKYKGHKSPAGLKHLIDAGYLGFRRKIGDIYPLQVQTTITRYNFKEIPEIARFCRANKIYLFLDSLIKDGRASQNYDKLKTDKNQDKWLYKELAKIYGLRFILLQKSVKCTLQGNPLIDAQGNFRFCVHRPEIIGNIRNESFSVLCERFRNMHKKVALPFTVGMLNNSFKTCPGRRYLEDED